MVITGATSGIGLTTARMAAEQGAQLMLIARNEDELSRLSGEINQGGGRAIHYAADVADERSLHDAAANAISEFGRIDTWVNNAGVAIYGKLMEVSEEDSRKMFDTNFWGVVAGSRVAAEHLREKGGALINLGSEVSDSPVPLIGMYAASKHAVKGFTDTLRMELESENLPVSVSLIKPTAIATPFSENAKNYLPFEPQVPQPVFAPELVAEAIIYCAQHPTRDFFVGEMAAVNSAMATYAPRLHDKLMESMAESMQNSGEPSTVNRRDGLHETNSQLRERFGKDRFVMETSVYQKAKLHPLITAGLLAGGGIAIASIFGKRIMKTDGYDRRQLQTGRNYMQDNGMKIAEHMEVVGSDGEHVGRVDKVEGDQIKLTKNDQEAGGQHHRISMDMVDTVDQNRVRLNRTAEDTMASWRSA
jgi:short-subunit dehydrogenase